MSIMPGVVDCSLLSHAFENATQPWTDEQKTAVSGFATWGACAKDSKGKFVDQNTILSRMDPARDVQFDYSPRVGL